MERRLLVSEDRKSEKGSAPKPQETPSESGLFEGLRGSGAQKGLLGRRRTLQKPNPPRVDTNVQLPPEKAPASPKKPGT